jgi:hypothetical protein
LQDRYSPPITVKWTVYLLLGSFSDNILKPALLGWKQKILHEMIEYWLSALYMPLFFGAFSNDAVRELRRVLGEGVIKKLFFQRRSDPEVRRTGRLNATPVTFMSLARAVRLSSVFNERGLS